MKIDEEDIDLQLNIAKALIIEFIAEEYNVGQLWSFDFVDLADIGIAYTTTEDGEHEIQIAINLIDYSINDYVDGELIHSIEYESLYYLIKYELWNLNFEDLIYVGIV